MQIDKKTIRNIFLGVAGCILLYWLLHEPERIMSVLSRVYNVLSPFVIGAAFAFIINVPMRGIEGWLKPIKGNTLRRILAILLTFVAVALVLAGVIMLLGPQLAVTVDSFIEMLPGFFDRLILLINETLDAHPQLKAILVEHTDLEKMDLSGLAQQAIALLTSGFGAIVDGAVSAVVGLYTGIFNGVLSLVFCVYCLMRKEILARQGRRILYSVVPERAGDEAVRILRMTNATFSNFLTGQCLEAVILGCMFAISMTIFKMPFMPLVSVIIAVTALVPIIGAFTGCILGAFFILVQDPLLAVWFVIMFLTLQQIEGNLIYPHVVGSSIGLPGMWVLVAVAIGGDLMGVGGMLLMIPIASVLYALAREITNKRLESLGIDREKLQDHPPEIVSKFKEKRLAKKQRLQKAQQVADANKQKEEV